jgi:phosphohistidine phosphatase
MRRLILMRHAKAEASSPGMADRARVLTARGVKDAGLMGAYMASHALTPDRALISPAARTQQTWKLTAPSLKPAPPAMAADALYDAMPDAIVDLIKAAPATAQTLFVLGHNPGMHDAAMMLVASGDIDTRERLREGLPTSGLIVIDFAFDDWSKLRPQSGRLERFVNPKWLEAATN